MKFYVIYCVNDEYTYGVKSDVDSALLRCKALAEKNIGNEYIVMESLTGYKCTFDGIKLEEVK